MGCGVCGAFPFIAGMSTTMANMGIIYTSSPIFINLFGKIIKKWISQNRYLNWNNIREIIEILNQHSIKFNEINTYESDLEDVFVELISKWISHINFHIS